MNENIVKASSELVSVLSKKGLRAACAESCTGGMIGAAITSVPGSSKVFLGGVISYDVSVKTGLLGVSENTLERFGVVSPECAAEMACGAVAAMDADIAVSVTGLAGPDGGSDELPVGTVCFGIATKNGCDSFTKFFDGTSGREGVRQAAVLEALEAMRRTAQNI